MSLVDRQLGLLLGADGGGWVRLFPEEASTSAARVDALFLALVAVMSLVAVTVGVFMIVFAARYRRGSAADRGGRIERTLPYEVTWIAVPTLISVGLFVWSGVLYHDLSRPPADALPIDVVGRQWMWKAQHPSGRREINALHVPAGRPVKLVLTSEDVIHSFFVPAFRVKRDVLPRRFTTLWFEATEPGTYHLFCAEYCGTEHAAMQGTVTVLRPAEYERWLSAESRPPGPTPETPGTPEAPLALDGQGLFYRYGCNACHTPSGAVRAPRLDGIYGRPVRLANGSTVTADDDYLRESILRPQAKIVAGYPEPSLMPSYSGRVSEEELDALTAFIRGLRDGWPPAVEREEEPR